MSELQIRNYSSKHFIALVYTYLSSSTEFQQHAISIQSDSIFKEISIEIQ